MPGCTADERRWYSGCSFVDYDRDGHLDLFVSSYLQFDFKSVPKPGEERTAPGKESR